MKSKNPNYEELEARVQELEEALFECKKANEALQRSEHEYQQLLSRMPVGIYRNTPGRSGRFLMANETIAKMFGYESSEDFIKTNVSDLYFDPTVREVFSRRLLSHGSVYNVPLSLKKKDGSLFWGSVTAIVVRNKEEEIEYFEGIIEDITERRKVEKQIESQNQIMSTLLDNLQVGVFMVEAPSGKPLLANKHAIKLLGRGIMNGAEKSNLAEVYQAFKSGTNDLYPEQDMPIVRGLMGESHSIDDMVVVQPNGDSVFLQVFGVPVKDSKGNITASIVSFSNITELKKINKALRESQDRLQSIFRAAPIGIGLVADRRILKVNDRLCEMTGYSTDELTGKNARILYPTEDDYEYVGSQKYRQIKAHGTGTVETRFKCKDGRIIDVLMSSTPIDQTDWLKGVTFTALDITKRKQAEKSLRESENKYRTLFQKSADAIFVVDKSSGKYLEANVAAENLTGRSISELIKLDTKEVTPDGSEKRLQVINSMDETIDLGDVVYVRPDGTNRIARLTAVQLDHKTVYGIAHDITEELKLKDQLIQAQKMEAVGRLAGGVAHDFNNMLSVIIGQASMALEEVGRVSPLYERLKEIERAGERSADLTRQLLAFARKQTISPKVVDLNKTVEGMFKMLKRLIGEDIELVWMPGKEVWPVKMDPSQIDQILANLCVNARDAITGVGKITIETATAEFDETYCTDHVGFIPGEYVLLAVSDNGCGMDAETLDNIFDPFFTTKGSDQGTGLGLATVYGVVKQNNGFVNAYSETGQGTTIKLYFPRYKTNAGALQEKSGRRPIKRGHETILLVEDEIAILKMTVQMLERMGYQVVAARTPGEAIRLAQEYADEIHLLLTDVVMPEMNGRGLAKKILSTYPNLKRLFMSGYTANVIAHHGVLDEGVNFIQKPFSGEQLGDKVREALDKDTL